MWTKVSSWLYRILWNKHDKIITMMISEDDMIAQYRCCSNDSDYLTIITSQCDAKNLTMTWLDSTWLVLTWIDSTLLCLTWLYFTWLDLTWLDLTWLDLTWLDLTWLWLYLTWLDLSWLDLITIVVIIIIASTTFIYITLQEHIFWYSDYHILIFVILSDHFIRLFYLISPTLTLLCSYLMYLGVSLRIAFCYSERSF